MHNTHRLTALPYNPPSACLHWLRLWETQEGESERQIARLAYRPLAPRECVQGRPEATWLAHPPLARSLLWTERQAEGWRKWLHLVWFWLLNRGRSASVRQGQDEFTVQNITFKRPPTSPPPLPLFPHHLHRCQLCEAGGRNTWTWLFVNFIMMMMHSIVAEWYWYVTKRQPSKEINKEDRRAMHLSNFYI